MRAICEACARPQPVDWQAPDLCIHCGEPVRPEVRCFWCVKWTPAAGKYCRSCGAEVVKGRLFGAARMLKDAGVDRFGIPKMLVELDPEQIENFLQIYNLHAAAVARHVDHVRFLERFLHQKDWSETVEGQLIVQLPWPDERLRAFSLPLDPAERRLSNTMSREESLALARYLANSPVGITRALAPLVCVLLEDFAAMKEAKTVIYNQNPLLRGEAALALTNWRVVYGPGIHDDRYPFMNALRDCPFRFQAAVHLALIGNKEDVLPDGALASDDQDIAFASALVLGDVDRLRAAERDSDPMKRYAAAWRMLRMGCFDGVDEVIRLASPEHQRELLGVITWQKRPPTDLRDALFALLETSADSTVRRDASWSLALSHQPGDTMRIARAARGDSQVYHGLLKTEAALSSELVELCEFLLERGEFRAEQWGMTDIAKEGRLPPDFVPRRWGWATEATRVELCKVAEMQLENYADEDLHRFLVNVVFGDEEFTVQEQAWTSLYRWYGRLSHDRMGPLLIKAETLRRFFGSAAAFVPILTDFLGGGIPRKFVKESSSRQELERFLSYADADVTPEWRAVPRAVLDLAGALAGVMKDNKCDLMVRLASIDLLVILAGVPEARQTVVGILKRSRKTDLDLGVTRALERIQSQ
jgi:hypothetical protein